MCAVRSRLPDAEYQREFDARERARREHADLCYRYDLLKLDALQVSEPFLFCHDELMFDDFQLRRNSERLQTAYTLTLTAATNSTASTCQLTLRKLGTS
jgi:hypothetical protein